MIEGPISSTINTSFWESRANFFQQNHQTSIQEYQEKTRDEIGRIGKIRRDGTVYLWFEHDLFCQCNLWFAAKMLRERKHSGKTFLVTPNLLEGQKLWLGFGNQLPDDHERNFKKKLLLAPLEVKRLAALWDLFSDGHFTVMESIATELQNILPLLPKVISAGREHFEIIPGHFNSTQQSLLAIIDNLKSSDFKKVFNEFNSQHGIYGFGDTQVYRIFKKIPMANRAILRNAMPSECEQLSEIAQCSKAHWGYPEEWLLLWKEELSIAPDDLENYQVRVLELDGAAVGFGALANKQGHSEIEHLWVLPIHIGMGLGKKLIHALIELGSGQELRVLSDPNAQKFYEKMGFQLSHEVDGLPKGRKLPLLIYPSIVHKTV